jgi:succinyl-diaminopimelate desuccinylase
MGGEIDVETRCSGAAFLTEPGAFTEILADATESVTGKRPEFSTGGGTSDARFIKNYCPVAEIGLPGSTMHKVDECMPVVEIEKLTNIYTAILTAYFAAPPKCQ